MNLKNSKLILLLFVASVILCNHVAAQATSTNNTLGTTGITGIQSTTNALYKLSVGGAVKIFGTGGSGLSSPSLYLINTASTTKYFINVDATGTFRIMDSAVTIPRFLINPTTGNIGIGIAATANNKLEIDNTTANTSGLRFTRLTSAATVAALNGKQLSVNATGDVILTNDSLSIVQSPNRVLAGPASGATAIVPTFRSLVAADIPSLSTTKISFTNSARLLGRFTAGTGAAEEVTIGSGLSLSGTGVLSATGGGTGTVTSFAFTNANGFTGTVATAGTTPALTLSTALNGLLRGNGTGLTTGQANLASEVTGTLPIANGGTGQTTFATGYIKSNGTVLSSSAAVAAADVSGNISGSAANVTGLVAVSNGGTGLNTSAIGDILYASAANTFSNRTIGTTGQVLTVSGGVPTWATPAANTNYWTASGNDVSNNNTGNVIINTNITSPGTGTGSEHFGNSSSTGTAQNATAIGNTAVANATGAVAIGKSITSAYSNSVGIGTNAIPSTINSVAIGNTISGVGGVGVGLNLFGGLLNIGSNNGAGTNHTSILIGSGLTATGQNELRIGSGLAGWWPTEIYLSGATANSLASVYGPQTYYAISGLGTDIAGQGMRFKAGKSTGSAAGGNISFFTTPAGAAGTTLNTEVERMRIDANGAIVFNGSAGTSGQVLTSGGAGAAPVWATAGGGGITTASNGLTAVSSNIKLGGDLINDTKIDVKNNWLWLKTPFKANEDTNKVGQVIIGDTNNVQKWSFPGGINTLYDHQKNAALIISKTKYNNNENVDFLSLTTADAPSKNGWVFMNYTNAAGIVRPRLETYSLDGVGYEHYLFAKGNTETAFLLNIANYDSLNLAGNPYKPISDNSNLFAINNGDVNKFVVKGNGKVGIGTTAPSKTLSVAGEASIKGGLYIDYANTTTYPNGNNWINFHHSQQDFTGQYFSGMFYNNNDGKLHVTSTKGNISYIDNFAVSTKVWDIGSNGYQYTTRFFIGATGGVGIGTTAVPVDYKLAVAGNIIAEKIKVKLQSGWPDYVFDKKYPLLSLTDLEKFITQNKHLPEVPTADDVKKNGIDLGDNQKILLQKIEELTLYIIEQNKKIEQLQGEKAKMQSLQQQIDELKKLILNK